MRNRQPSTGQLDLPYGMDAALIQLADGESVQVSFEAKTQAQRAAELLSAITGLRHNQAEEVLQKAGGLRQLVKLPEHTLAMLPHIGTKHAKQVRSLTDWAVLLNSLEHGGQVQIRSPADLANLVMLDMGLLEQEELRVIGLDTKNHLSFMNTVYKGSLNTAVIRVAEVLRAPIAWQCASMAIIHNHPSGDPTPSPEDVRVTELIREGGQLFDIALLDHIIIGQNRYTSLKEKGLGFA